MRKKRLTKSLRMVKMIRKQKVEVSQTEIFARIRLRMDYEGFEQADMVFENITENFEKKKIVYNELQSICKPEVLYGVNTSCISITRIAAQTCHPAKVIGTHFMNPVPLNPMVEVIRGFHTAPATEEIMLTFLKNINKEIVVVGDMPGFVSNRLSHLLMNEAAYLIQEKVATPAEVDLIFKKGYGHSMGPLETADLIGLDTVANTLDMLYDSYLDQKFCCCPLIRQMVSEGLLGQKSGRGFYEYT